MKGLDCVKLGPPNRVVFRVMIVIPASSELLHDFG